MTCMKLLNKTLSVVLAFVMVLTAVPFAAFAEDDETAPQTSTQQDITYEASNTLGEIIANAANEKQEEQKDNNGYGIFDVRLSGLTAAVQFSAPDDTTLAVAVYDEDSKEMVAYGKTEVDSSVTEADVILTDCEEPNYYIIKAFLLDAENAPVCLNYENRDHTRLMEKFFEKSADDFDDEKVINFDYSNEDNFAVVSDNAKTSAQTANTNILVTNDYENGIYTFRNADRSITSLHPGDILFFTYGEGEDEYILTKIASLKTSGNLTTISSSEDCEISDFFSYIDLDTAKIKDSPIATASFDENEGNENTDKSFNRDSGKKNYTAEGKYSLELELSAAITPHVSFRYDFYLFGPDHYEFSYWVDVTALAQISFKISGSFETTQTLIETNLPLVAGLDIHFALRLTFNASASFTAVGSMTFTMKEGAKTNSDTKRQESISEKPKLEYKVQVDGNFQIDIIPQVSVGFRVLYVFLIDFNASFDFMVKGVLFVPTLTNAETSDEKKHLCSACIDGSINLIINGSLTVKFGTKESKAKDIINLSDLLNKTIELGNFYVSFYQNTLRFGWGKCPYCQYKVTFEVVDESGNPLQKAKINDGTHILTTDKNGKSSCYHSPEICSCTVSLDKYVIDRDIHLIYPIFFQISDSAVTVNLHMKQGENEEVTPNPTDSPIGGTIEHTGDVITFGSYPQSKVTDQTIIDALNQKASGWTSYNYYSNKIQGDWMQYCDVLYNGERYRGVNFTEYRPYLNTIPSSAGNSEQDNRGYYTGITYWFKFDPIKWKVLDPEKGLIFSNLILDSQTWNDTVYTKDGTAYNDLTYTKLANDYSASSIRNWLNNTFINTAFTATEKKYISITEISNKAYSSSYSQFDVEPTKDYAFLLSYDDIFNRAYGFTDGESRRARGSDYANCQGLWAQSTGYSTWWLRSAGQSSNYPIAINDVAGIHTTPYAGTIDVRTTEYGIKPALTINLSLYNAQTTIKQDKTDILLKDPDKSLLKQTNKRETLNSAIVGNTYIMLIVKDEKAEDLLSVDNLLYIDQKIADSETLSFDFALDKSDMDYKALFFGAFVATEDIPEPAPHTHVFSVVADDPATCLNAGSRTVLCEGCGYTETQTLPALGHSLKENTTPPTCTKDGRRETVCERCDYKKTETLPATGHSDNNHDGQCDTCQIDLTKNCSHICHSSNSLIQFIYKIIRLFWMIFGIKQYCSCGYAHY